MSTRPLLIHSLDVDRQVITRPLDRRFIRRLLLLLLFAVPVMVMTLLIIQTNNRLFQTGKQIRYLEFQQRRLEDERLELLLERERLLRPDEVTQKAAAQGLEPLKPEQVNMLYVE
jgi:cell division protein FtsL